ncbi:MAG: hypothetical protein M5T61_21230 [Acidimicrobiia bacterium]|nr:hypothetical protein [Acidimicrobiia bacterium]
MVEFQRRRFRLFATVIALGIIAALAAAGGAARTSVRPSRNRLGNPVGYDHRKG